MAKKNSSSRKNGVYYNTDRVAVCIFQQLLRDFRRTEGPAFMRENERGLLADINQFRAIDSKELGNVSVGRFKRVKQIEAFLKKYRFSTDAYTDDELSKRSIDKYLKEQVRLHTTVNPSMTGSWVCRRARSIARSILGEFPGDEVVENVQFGKKSSIGCPLSQAYIDNKLSNVRAFTATGSTFEHFRDQVLPGDVILQRILKGHDFKAISTQLDVPYLTLVEVPKTWKVYRIITPLTLIGLFYSYGIGRVVQKRLQDAGLDIRRLQHRHQGLVRQFSQVRSHATADLSAASDSITSELLNRVLPRPWYNALKKTFVRNVNYDDRLYSTVSVLPMGNGATFPVETLVFYCLIKAIGELSKIKGIYSVYGDDLIYPSRLHKYVVGIFPQLKLVLNLDKTFVKYPFRESCGADFYRGQDVRPYYMKGESSQLTATRYEAFLYKLYNGLTARWHPEEIRDTLTWLLSELTMVAHTLKRVPPSFPDYSGVKVSDPVDIPLSYTQLPWSPISIRFVYGSRWFQFDFLTETAKKRVVNTVEPYYWLALQGRDDESSAEQFGALIRRDDSVLPVLKNEDGSYHRLFPALALKGIPKGPYSPLDKPRTMLSWEKLHCKVKQYWFRGRKRVKRRTNYVAVVSSRKGATVSTASTRTGSHSVWI